MTQTVRLLAILLILAPLPVLAQSTTPSMGRSGPSVNSGGSKDDDVVAKPVPPPALPGAEPATEGVIPSDKTAADMPPTEALFDAIHRGDVVSARDALNRGADLEGHNVLGQSPLDLAIDLNRNDITFLLLSMRGSGASEHEPRSASAGAPEDRAPRGRHQRDAKARVAQDGTGRQGTADRTLPALPAGEARPQLFAGDGGEAKPAIGFLGFGTR